MNKTSSGKLSENVEYFQKLCDKQLMAALRHYWMLTGIEMKPEYVSTIEPVDAGISFKGEGKLVSLIKSLDCEPLDMALIGFQPGDGTGSSIDRKLIGVPEKYIPMQLGEKSIPVTEAADEQWTPIIKTGYAQLIIPLITYDNGRVLENATSLEAWTLKGDRPEKYAFFNAHIGDINTALYNPPGMLPVSLPTIQLAFDKSVENPNVIILPEFFPRDTHVQFAAFVTLRDDKLGRNLKKYATKSVPKLLSHPKE